MVIKRVLRPERLRRVPAQFSWVDERLVREGYLERSDAPALALYLLRVTVADAQGLSYYGDAAICRMLSLSPERLQRASRESDRRRTDRRPAAAIPSAGPRSATVAAHPPR